MANSIVFQSSAEQLKTSIYGYDGSSYKALNVSSGGTLQTIVTGGTVSLSGNTTVRLASGHATVTLNPNNATISLKAGSTIRLASNHATVALNSNNATVALKAGATISLLSGNATVSLNPNNATVALKAGATISLLSGNATVALNPNNATVALKTGSTIRLVTGHATIAVNNTVNIKLADKSFIATIQISSLSTGNPTYTELIDISKCQDTSWYIQNISTSKQNVTVQLAVTPSSDIVSYPRVLIQQTATVVNDPVVITNDYYMKYICAHFTTSSVTLQTMRLVFNGRY